MQADTLSIYPEKLGTDIPHQYREQTIIGNDTFNWSVLFGVLRTRDGWRSIGNTTDGLDICGIETFRAIDGTNNAVIVTTTHVYSSQSPNYQTLTDRTGGTALTSTNVKAAVFAPVLGPSKSGVVCTNNNDQPFLWNVGDATRTVLTNAPSVAKAVAVAYISVAGQSRVVFGNTTESAVHFGSRVRWSALGDATTYPSTAFADLTASNDDIIAILPLTRSSVAIYKAYSQWVGIAQPGSDASAFRFELVDRQPGPIGPKAIINGPSNTHIYIGNDGNIYQFDGAQSRQLSRLSDYNQAVLDNSNADNNVLLYVPRQSVVHAFTYPFQNTDTSNLISISSASTTNLISISSANLANLVALGSLLQSLMLNLGNGQLYPEDLGGQQKLRAAVNLTDINNPIQLAGMGSTLYLSDSVVDTAQSSQLPAVLTFLLPMLPATEWVFDSATLWFDAFSSTDTITVSVSSGRTPESLSPITLYQMAVPNDGFVQVYNPLRGTQDIRARSIKVSVSGYFTSRTKLRRLDIAAWKEPVLV